MTPRNFIRLLQRDECVLLFPGGVRESNHGRGENNKLFWCIGIMYKNFLLIILILLVSPSVETKENINYFDAMDIFDLEWASDPQVSSDGETIVYVRKSNDIMKDRVRSILGE